MVLELVAIATPCLVVFAFLIGLLHGYEKGREWNDIETREAALQATAFRYDDGSDMPPLGPSDIDREWPALNGDEQDNK